MKLSKQSLKAMLLLTLGSCVTFAQAPPTYAYNGPPQNVGFTTGSNATFISIPVSSTGTVTKVTVTVNISYPLVSDLNLYLFSPDGTRTKLLEHNCSGTPSATLVNMTFDDSASTLYNSFCPVRGRTRTLEGKRTAVELQQQECRRHVDSRYSEQRFARQLGCRQWFQPFYHRRHTHHADNFRQYDL